MYYTIKPADVGKMIITWNGRKYSTSFMGRILPGNIGKRIYRTLDNAGYTDVLQVENDEQMTRRLQGGNKA